MCICTTGFPVSLTRDVFKTAARPCRRDPRHLTCTSLPVDRKGRLQSETSLTSKAAGAQETGPPAVSRRPQPRGTPCHIQRPPGGWRPGVLATGGGEGGLLGTALRGPSCLAPGFLVGQGRTSGTHGYPKIERKLGQGDSLVFTAALLPPSQGNYIPHRGAPAKPPMSVAKGKWQETLHCGYQILPCAVRGGGAWPGFRGAPHKRDVAGPRPEL